MKQILHNYKPAANAKCHISACTDFFLLKEQYRCTSCNKGLTKWSWTESDKIKRLINSVSSTQDHCLHKQKQNNDSFPRVIGAEFSFQPKMLLAPSRCREKQFIKDPCTQAADTRVRALVPSLHETYTSH